MTTLRGYLRSRLLLLGLLLVVPLMYLIVSLYHLGLDDATELYLQQDLNWLVLELDRTGELPVTQPYKTFALGRDALPILYRDVTVSLNDQTYFYVEDYDSAHYGIRGYWHNQPIFVVHEFPLEEPVEGLQLETIIAAMVLLIVFLMILGAWVMYRKISLSMWALDSVASHDGHWSEIDVELFEFREVYDVAHALKQTIEQLDIKRQQERMFIQSLSHELRTPMAIIQIALEVLKKKPLDEAIESKLNSIFNANQKMQTLANDMLGLWHPDGPDDQQSLNLLDVISESISQLDKQYHCEERFELQSGEDISSLYCSTLAVQLLIVNVLKNAVIHGTGIIHISYNSQSISVTNLKSQEDLIHGESVGLGMFIVRRATEILGWQYETSEDDENYRVTLYFK